MSTLVVAGLQQYSLQTLTLPHMYCVPRLTDASDADTTVVAGMDVELQTSQSPMRAALLANSKVLPALTQGIQQLLR
jgi:hypothetical protein